MIYIRDPEKSCSENYNHLMECDEEAKKNSSWIGRVFKYPYADGCSYYQIIEENSKNFRMAVCVGVEEDDWKAFGEICVMPKQKAIKYLIAEERFHRSIKSAFSRKEKANGFS